ncbi:MAG: hypothetical protein V4636_23460 [Pseudomonadota bacterium]
MRSISSIALCALAVGLGACSGTPADAPSDAVFTTAVQNYLARHGDLCLAKNHWPIDVTQHEIDVGGRNARQMPVLERLGLVDSSVAEVDVDDEGTLHHMKVRRFALTDAGRKYYVVRDVSGDASRNAVGQGDFCAAHLSLDRVVGWKLNPAAEGRPQRAVVSYTYKIDPAPWTSDAEAQRVFPVVAGVVRGAGTAQLQESFRQTKDGWVPVELEGS